MGQNVSVDKKAKAPPAKQAIPEELMCAICTDVMTVPSTLIPCMHTFCKKCIDSWLAQANSCPICKTNVQMNNKNHLVEQIIANFEK